jgi:hypothetical protein
VAIQERGILRSHLLASGLLRFARNDVNSSTGRGITHPIPNAPAGEPSLAGAFIACSYNGKIGRVQSLNAAARYAARVA